jgi:putative addiction module component (TIGR02574 family)
MTWSCLLDEIRNLPIADRLELMERIWDSIAEDEQNIQLTDAQKAELDRRLAAHEASPDRGASWEAVKARLLSDYITAK